MINKMRIFCRFIDTKNMIPIICFEIDSPYFHFPQSKEIIFLNNCYYSIIDIFNNFEAEDIGEINQTIDYHLKKI